MINPKEYLIKYGIKKDTLDLDDKLKLNKYLKQYEKGKPLQYIVGNTNFYGYDFIVNKDVLIPRFETEELVNYLIEDINKYFNKKIDILDLCTGSGAIGITLDKETSNNIDISDISKKALKIANINKKNLNSKVTIIQSNLFENITKKYDCIVSNPPYIGYNEVIDNKVYNNEPHLALFANNNGLYFYEEILKNCSKFLKEEFIIAFEISYKQGKLIKLIASQYLENIQISIIKDLSNKDRFLFIYKFNE
ncbi:MAG: peptide chain release factor N(5)-glutamine methyltransferase [Bacilli bacterium]